MRRTGKSAVVLLVAALALLAAATVQADRKATGKEARQLTKGRQLPPRCATVRISTVTVKPIWGSVTFKPADSGCEPFASDGVTIARKRKHRWRYVTAGSSFDCPSLYKAVPKSVVMDLGITCHQP